MNHDLMEECKRRIGPLKLPVHAKDGALLDADGEVVAHFYLTIGKAEYEWARCQQVADLLNQRHDPRPRRPA